MFSMNTYVCVSSYLPDHVTSNLCLTSASHPPAGREGPGWSSRSSAQPERPDGDPQHPPPAEEPQPAGQTPVRTQPQIKGVNIPVESSALTGSVCPTGTQRSGRLTDPPPTRSPPADLGPAEPWSRARPLCPGHLSQPGAGIFLLLLGPSCHWFPAPVKQGLSMRSSAGHDCKQGTMGRLVSPLALSLHVLVLPCRLGGFRIRFSTSFLPSGCLFVTSASQQNSG